MAASDDLDGLLRHVPAMSLPDRVNGAQAAGVDLPIVVINLPHRTDRWEALSSRMTAVGLDRLIRAPAVIGASLEDNYIQELLGKPGYDASKAPRSHLALTRPAIGCFLSHLAIWRWVIRHNIPRVMIFEDDAKPAPYFDAGRFRAAVEALPGDAGLVFTGRIIMSGMADEPRGATLARLYYFNGTFAYMITPAACRTLIARLMPPERHIDHQISKVLVEQRHDFHAHYTEPHFFEPDWSLRSDCFVPIEQETEADRELFQLITRTRQLLLDEGRPLLSPDV